MRLPWTKEEEDKEKQEELQNQTEEQEKEEEETEMEQPQEQKEQPANTEREYDIVGAEDLGDVFRDKRFKVRDKNQIVMTIQRLETDATTGFKKAKTVEFMGDTQITFPIHRSDMEEFLPPGKYLIRVFDSGDRRVYYGGVLVKLGDEEESKYSPVISLESEINSLKEKLNAITQTLENIQPQQEVKPVDPQAQLNTLLMKLVEDKLLKPKEQVNLAKIAEQVTAAMLKVQEMQAELQAAIEKKKLDLELEKVKHKNELDLKKYEIQLQEGKIDEEEDKKSDVITRFMTGLENFVKVAQPALAEIRKIQELAVAQRDKEVSDIEEELKDLEETDMTDIPIKPVK